MPEMNVGYEMVNNKPTMVVPAHVNLGLAIDLPRPDGTRRGLTPHTLTSRGGAVVVDAMAPVHPRAGRRWSPHF